MKEDKEKSLDFAQLVVNTVRMIPVVGKPTNIVNAGGSLDRKDRIRSVAISMLGAIPIVGDVSNMVSKGKRMLDPTKTLSEEFEAFLEDLPKGIYKKTITGASRKVISPERLAEMIQEKIKMLEFESARGCLSNTCFPGGTPILTQAGPIPIEQIKVGMLVNTQNPETGESGDQAVLSVSQTHVRKLFHIHVGKTEIKSTAMHRLYVQEKGFIPAQDLKVGDRLLGLKEGAPETFPIDQIAVQFYETPVVVYNFEVAAWHTYRVGEIGILVHNGKKTCSGKIPEPKKDENLILDLLGYYDIKEVITDIAHGEVDLDTLKAGASLIPVAKIAKVPKVVKAIGNVGKTGSKKGKEGEKTVWKRFTQKDQPQPDKNKGNQSKTGSKGSTTTSKPNQEEASKSGQVKQTKAKNKGGSGTEELVYKPNDGKHKGTARGDISADPFWNNQVAGKESLNNAYSSKNTKQLYNVYDYKLVKFQPDNAGTWHAYEVRNPAAEVPADVLRNMKDDGLITRVQYNKWIKGK